MARYLSKELSLEEFEDWFVPSSWNIQTLDDEKAAQLAYEIDLRLAEYSSGHRTEADLRKLLKPLAKSHSHAAAESA